MILLAPRLVEADAAALSAVDRAARAIYRLVIFSREHDDDDLLDRYLASIHQLRELISIKNAQMEAQTEEEARDYLVHLRRGMEMIVEEVRLQRNIERPLDLMRLFRIVSPEAYGRHPNRFRDGVVQVGRHVAPPPEEVPGLIEQVFDAMRQIGHPLLRAAYLHHELVRIHPLADGNGRVSRMAKNWMLMYELYPPIFIRDVDDRGRYIGSLEESFASLERDPSTFGEATRRFFADEVSRVGVSARYLLDQMTGGDAGDS